MNSVECLTSPNGNHRFSPGKSNCDFCHTGGIVVNGEVLYVPHPKQLEYHSRTEPNVLFWGGRGSGKSMCGRWDAHMRALSYPGFKYAILRRTFPELEKSHLIYIQKEMKQLGGTFNWGSKKAFYPNGSIGFFSHCSDETDVLNLLSAEFHLMVFDELSTFEWEMYTKLAMSIRSLKGSGIVAMARGLTNPLGPCAQDLIKYFVDKSVDPEEDAQYNPNDWYSIHANLEDNPSVDQEQYKKRFSGLPSHVYKAWVEGEFALENALFTMHPKITTLMAENMNLSGDYVGKPYHVINDIDLPKIIKNSTIYRTIDVGWFPDPTVVLWIAHLGNRHIVFNEMIRYKTTAADTAAEILEEDKRLGIGKVAMTFCDPSMDINTTADIRTVKEVYEANGVPMECSINNREMFATAMHNALNETAGEATPRIQFFTHGTQGCPYLVKTIPQMRYHPKKYKAMDDHKDDHAVVAACYYLMTHAADPRQSVGGGVAIRPWMKPKTPERFVLGRENVRDSR